MLQKDVAQQIGVDPSSVYNWENNRSSPTLHLIPTVIEYLGYLPEQDVVSTIGQQVFLARRFFGIRQDELAHQLDVDPGTLGRWERGKSRPSVIHLIKLNEFLSVALPEDTRGLEG